MFKRTTLVLVVLAAASLTLPAWGAKPVPDPTRPTWPRVEKAGASQHWQVNSIRMDTDGKRVALVNGTPVTEGDSVAGARVLRIDAEHVVLRAADRTFTLTLLHDGVQKTSR